MAFVEIAENFYSEYFTFTASEFCVRLKGCPFSEIKNKNYFFLPVFSWFGFCV